jgi:hypothetical protein
MEKRAALRGLSPDEMIAVQAAELAKSEGGGAAWANALASRADLERRHADEQRQVYDKAMASMAQVATSRAAPSHGAAVVAVASPHGSPTAAVASPHGSPTAAVASPHGSPTAAVASPHGSPTAAVASMCPSCGSGLRADAKFCNACGKSTET